MYATSSTDRRARRSWVELHARVPATIAEDVAGWVGSGSLGVQVRPDRDGAASVSVYLADRAAADDRRCELDRAVAAFGVDPAAVAVEVRTVGDPGWVEAYQARLRPLPLGSRFVVVPGRDHDVADGRDPIRLVPGRAFGTGEHPTTRLCAAELEREVEAGSAWLDIGTGSGILAVVAARCGASTVRGIDIDADAVAVAREVVAENPSPGARVRIAPGEASDEPDRAWDGVVANVSEPFVMTSCAELGRVLRPGGRLVVSGFLREDGTDVDRILAEHGLRVVRAPSEGAWAARVARLDASRPDR